jgi:predicted transcriptional regulator
MPAAAPPRRPAVAKKKPTSFRLSDEAHRILDELKVSLQTSERDVVERALRELYDKDQRRRKPPKKSEDGA